MKIQLGIIVLALFCFTSNIKGQFSLHGGAGASFSNIFNLPNAPNTSNYVNGYLSAYPEFKLSSKFSVGVEVQGITRGFQIDESSSHKFVNLDIIPQAEFRPLSYLGLVAGAGTSLNLDESVKVNNIWQNAIFNFSNQVNFTWVAGFRVYPLKKWNISCQYSNTHLSKLELTDVEGNNIGSGLLKLGTLKIGIGFRFI